MHAFTFAEGMYDVAQCRETVDLDGLAELFALSACFRDLLAAGQVDNGESG